MDNSVVKQKILGDITSELKSAGISIASTQFLQLVKIPIAKQMSGCFNNVSENEIFLFLDSPVGEGLLSFVLASALNLLPTERMAEERAAVAQNLRIQSYVKIGNTVASTLQPMLMQALSSAKEFDQIQ